MSGTWLPAKPGIKGAKRAAQVTARLHILLQLRPEACKVPAMHGMCQMHVMFQLYGMALRISTAWHVSIVFSAVIVQ